MPLLCVRRNRVRPALLFAALLNAIAIVRGADAPSSAAVDFARDIAPLFQQHCIRCHQPAIKKGELSLATYADLGALQYVAAGKPAESHLIEVVSASDGGRPLMPKDGAPLTATQVDLLRRWIEQGAAWPADVVIEETSKADQSWWSLRALTRPEPPSIEGLPAAWQASPIDRFVFAKLAAAGLQPNPPADRAALIRRLSYDLIGLPPTPEEVSAFVTDTADDAYERIVERLLASPHYGEQWGRHWLDVVRFGESSGFEQNFLIDTIWPYRDYVVRAFNEDRPFDRFVLEQLAGDAVGAGDPNVEVGLTFLVCGPFDSVGNQDAVQAAQIRANTIDELIRTTSESFLGLTVGCARCHNHKFDPIAQRDYYRLYATFAGVFHDDRAVATDEQRRDRDARLQPLTAERDRLAAARAALTESIIQAATGHHEAGWTRPAVARTGTEETFAPVEARFVRLVVAGGDTNPASNAHYKIDEFEVWTASDEPRNVAAASRGGKAIGVSPRPGDFGAAYSADLVIDGKFGERWTAAAPELTIELAAPQHINRVFFSSDRLGTLGQHGTVAFVCEYRIEVSRDGQHWTTVADSHDRQPVHDAHRRHRLFELGASADQRGQVAELSRQIGALEGQMGAIPAPPVLRVGRMEQPAAEQFLFERGDPQRKGETVLPASIGTLERVTQPYELPATAAERERRLRLAEWIVARDNPLTPRVLANRLWHYHFGTGLVDTPSDLGYMGGRPSHPELLDWLAAELHDQGWRLKPLHRQIVLSQTYRQAATFREDAAKVDANSRLLWRFPPRRLAGEEIRDALLAVAGKLDTRAGGPGFRLYHYLRDNVSTYVPLDRIGPETYRRAIYHQNARASRIDVVTDFDGPDCAFPAPRRVGTTTPLQALTMMNHSFTLDMAGFLAARVEKEAPGDIRAQVQRTFRWTFSREPSEAEASAALALVERHGLRAFCRAVLNANEFIYLN